MKSRYGKLKYRHAKYFIRYEQKDKTLEKHTYKKHIQEHTHKTQKFLGRHMVQRQVRNIRCLTCRIMFIEYTNRETVVYTILNKARGSGLC